MNYFNATDYNNYLITQDYKCKICKRHQNQFTNRLHVDHNHITNEVRGLLCSRCNLVVGVFETNLVLIPEIVDYLKYSNTGKQFHRSKHRQGRYNKQSYMKKPKFNRKAGANKKHRQFMG